MKKYFDFGLLEVTAILLMALLLAWPAAAQELPKAPEPNAGKHVEISATYDINGNSENQASVFGIRVPLTDRWSVQYRSILAPNSGNSGVQFQFGEVLYSRRLSDILKAKSRQFNAERFTIFCYGGIGAARKAIAPDNASFAWSAGCGANLRLKEGIDVTLAEYSYARARVDRRGIVLSSHHQILLGPKLSF